MNSQQVPTSILGRGDDLDPLTIVVGVVGSFIGRFIGSLIGVGATLTEFSIPGLLMSLLGAIVLLGIANMVQRGRVR